MSDILIPANDVAHVDEIDVALTWDRSSLHLLSNKVDSLADHYVKLLVEQRGPGVFKDLFSINTNSTESLEEQFPEIKDFFEQTYQLPESVDLHRIHRGEEIFLHHTPSGALVLLAKSLPEGYSAPRLSKILGISGLLETSSFKRLLATLHMLINVSSAHGFSHRGHAVVTAQKLRLWHAAVRHAVPKYLPDFYSQYGGVPVNQCDMLATIMGFSLVVIQGWRTLGIRLSAKHEEDFYYVWRVFALMMGIHPEGEPHSFAYIPETVADAERFYAAYCAEYYVEASGNPEGVKLATANLNLLRHAVPWWLAIFGLRALPRAYMQLLIGVKGCVRIAMPFRLHEKILEQVLRRLHRFAFIFEIVGRVTHFHLPLIVFKTMIFVKYGTDTQIMIPPEIADVWYTRAKKSTKRKK
jgi:hypothetical protein